MSPIKKLMARIDGDPDPLIEKVLKAMKIDFHYGEIKACQTCGHFACVCSILEKHLDGCQFRLATTCSVPVECDHGFDVCPTCDPCTCELVRAAQGVK